MGVTTVTRLFCQGCGNQLKLDELGSDFCYWCMIEFTDEWLTPYWKNKIKLNKNEEDKTND